MNWHNIGGDFHRKMSNVERIYYISVVKWQMGQDPTKNRADQGFSGPNVTESWPRNKRQNTINNIIDVATSREPIDLLSTSIYAHCHTILYPFPRTRMRAEKQIYVYACARVPVSNAYTNVRGNLRNFSLVNS